MKKRKMVIVMRTDLGMSPGKMVAQGGHAVVGVLDGRPRDEEWYDTGMKKAVLAVDSEEKLLEIYLKAFSRGVNRYIVQDAGLTELPPGTRTCLALGPDSHQRIERITGSLKLL